MDTSFEDLQFGLGQLGDVELEALAIAVERELSRRKQNEELIAMANGSYELKSIKSGNKIFYYWYLRYWQGKKHKSKYLGKGLETEATPPPQIKDKGFLFLETLK